MTITRINWIHFCYIFYSSLSNFRIIIFCQERFTLPYIHNLGLTFFFKFTANIYTTFQRLVRLIQAVSVDTAIVFVLWIYYRSYHLISAEYPLSYQHWLTLFTICLFKSPADGTLFELQKLSKLATVMDLKHTKKWTNEQNNKRINKHKTETNKPINTKLLI